MKQNLLKKILILTLFVFTASPALATDVSMKIGVVDLNKAVNESAQGKKAKIEVEALIKSKQEALDAMGKKLEKLKIDLDKQGEAISAEAKKIKQDELERLAREYQRAVSDSQGEVAKKESELTRGIVVGVKAIVRVMAEEDKYNLILVNDEVLVLFADKGLDITDKVVKKYDESQQKTVKK